MKLRRDLVVDFDRKALTDMIISAMASMIHEFLGTGEQDLILHNVGTISSSDWTTPKQLQGTYVSFVYTGNIRLATVGVSCYTETRDLQWFNVIIDLNREGRPVLAVYEDDRNSGEDQVFINFDVEALDFTIPPRN